MYIFLINSHENGEINFNFFFYIYEYHNDNVTLNKNC